MVFPIYFSKYRKLRKMFHTKNADLFKIPFFGPMNFCSISDNFRENRKSSWQSVTIKKIFYYKGPYLRFSINCVFLCILRRWLRKSPCNYLQISSSSLKLTHLKKRYRIFFDNCLQTKFVFSIYLENIIFGCF